MTLLRTLSITTASITCALLLHICKGVLPTPPLHDFAHFNDYWNTHGTAVAAFSIARVVGLVLCFYLVVISILATSAELTRWHWLTTLTRWLSTPALYRLLIGSSLAVALTASPAAAIASVTPGNAIVRHSSSVDHVDVDDHVNVDDHHFNANAYSPSIDKTTFTVTDMGAVTEETTPEEVVTEGIVTEETMTEGETPIGLSDLSIISNFTVTDMGEATRTDDDAAPAGDPDDDRGQIRSVIRTDDDAGPAGDGDLLSEPASTGEQHEIQGEQHEPASTGEQHEVWLVQHGDNLWGIAAATVLERTGTTKPQDVSRYWHDLIDSNSDILNDRPDLIYPGQIIYLPDQNQAQGIRR